MWGRRERRLACLRGLPRERAQELERLLGQVRVELGSARRLPGPWPLRQQKAIEASV